MQITQSNIVNILYILADSNSVTIDRVTFTSKLTIIVDSAGKDDVLRFAIDIAKCLSIDCDITRISCGSDLPQIYSLISQQTLDYR